jgi:tetratricopeptide (TPR) repeat protein
MIAPVSPSNIRSFHSASFSPTVSGRIWILLLAFLLVVPEPSPNAAQAKQEDLWALYIDAAVDSVQQSDDTQPKILMGLAARTAATFPAGDPRRDLTAFLLRVIQGRQSNLQGDANYVNNLAPAYAKQLLPFAATLGRLAKFYGDQESNPPANRSKIDEKVVECLGLAAGIETKALPKNSQRLANTLFAYGIALATVGQLQAATHQYKAAIVIFDQQQSELTRIAGAGQHSALWGSSELAKAEVGDVSSELRTHIMLGRAYLQIGDQYNQAKEDKKAAKVNARGAYQLAEQEFRHVLRSLGSNWPNTRNLAIRENDLAAACLGQESFQEAERYYRKALIILRQTDGECGRDTKNVAVGLTISLRKLNRENEAATIDKQYACAPPKTTSAR